MTKARGFTLLELMVVLAIIAILVTLAAPSFTRLIQSTTVSSNVNNFLADMRYARSESTRRGGQVVMCRSDAPEAAPRVTIVVASLEPRTLGAAMKEISGTLRTIIQGPGSSSAVAA
jgi:prepilin-type N-terminal cleavage/methylation domain-containing protein